MPLFVTLLAFIATILAFPFINSDSATTASSSEGGYNNNFMCYQMVINNKEHSGRPTICVPLYLTYTFYYTNYIEQSQSKNFIWYTDEDRESLPFFINETKWGYSMQAAAICGVIAALFGIVACFILVQGSCFYLNSFKIKKVLVLQTLSLLLTIASIILGFTVNPCSIVKGRSTCKVNRCRLETGSCSMIVASVLYIVAIYTTHGYHKYVRNDENEIQLQSQIPVGVIETEPLLTVEAATTAGDNKGNNEKDKEEEQTTTSSSATTV